MARREILEGLEEFDCYDDSWLYKDMENMGYLFEYCETYIRRLFHVRYNIDVEKFINDFMNSDIRALMEIGHPHLLSQAAEDSCEDFINVDNNGDYAKYRLRGKRKYYYHYQLYWIGWMYAYIHFMTKLPSDEIIKKMPLDEMLWQYKLGHEMSKEVFFDKIKEAFK